ncbi:hypothetical protein B0H67DRAFT_643972 [Lasiosphaeris hirsuta]|uniref:Uncharacterized protein n=1 Tax=Lasiosphaeris hirsuta TaxID=260670 RepID=A0AA40ARN9_9PEZI|nr:hypothetical protein B0H67DRAFT_643972 [Lasiosphaeris hirsuta]
MSPIAAQAAFRAAARASQSAGRRNFSVLNSMRGFARSFESHPFERLPAATRSQSADWGRQVKRVGSQTAIFLPFFAAILGWPYAARLAVGDHV